MSDFNVCPIGRCRNEEEKDVTQKMLADVVWLRSQLKSIGSKFDKQVTTEYINGSVEFAKGVLWERERDKSQGGTT